MWCFNAGQINAALLSMRTARWARQTQGALCFDGPSPDSEVAQLISLGSAHSVLKARWNPPRTVGSSHETGPRQRTPTWFTSVDAVETLLVRFSPVVHLCALF
ncbi:hypothetical protein DPEC_G00056460 [Dallia pectoralis]|uniref:Uncharacterized protein n=1 Tax=Dallia pectoralis TaxID=75939 RepID=A0ACC2H6G2_DALPE|nr:hypothetical protein DPEC_G00056460 [Dallia pectoralis]